MGDSANLEIVLRAPAYIQNTSKLSEGYGEMDFFISRVLDKAKIKIGYKLYRNQVIDRGSINGNDLIWKEDEGVYKGRYRIPIQDANVMQIFLSYDGYALHQWWLTDPKKQLNPRDAIHQVFDSEYKMLQDMLFKPEVDKAPAFEWAVSSLLSVLGFSVVNYGRIPKLQRGPDIIAITPTGHVAVVECTLGLLNENNKLAKLIQRTELMREKLLSAGYGHVQLQPVIVTALSRGGVAVDLNTAGKHNIAVVCKEDLDSILKQMSLPPHADKLFEDAKRLIPIANKE